MRLSKKTLFGEKNIPFSKIYKEKKHNESAYNTIVSSFTNNSLLKALLFKFIKQIPYNINSNILKKQLALLEPLSFDDKLKVLNITVDNKWESLIPAYEILSRKKFDNIKTKFESKESIIKNTDIVQEGF